MLLNHIILAMLWIIYVVLHSVLASMPIKQKMQAFLGAYFKHYRLGYTVFAFLSLAFILWFQFSISTIHFYRPSLFILIIGSLIALTGLIIMLICIRKYFVGLSGLRSLFQETLHSELIISGIHRFIRHPLYLGTFIFIWGMAILFPYLSLIISNFIITIYTLIAIRFEEEKLIAEFGEQYRHYQQSVPKLIPRF